MRRNDRCKMPLRSRVVWRDGLIVCQKSHRMKTWPFDPSAAANAAANTSKAGRFVEAVVAMKTCTVMKCYSIDGLVCYKCTQNFPGHSSFAVEGLTYDLPCHFGLPYFCLARRLVSWSASPICWPEPRRHISLSLPIDNPHGTFDVTSRR